MSVLQLEHFGVTLRDRVVINDVTLSIEAGEFVGLIGPNGAGKTTLLRAALGLIPATGQSNIAAMTNDARARHAAWMPQARDIAWPIRVEDAVRLGKRPGASDAPVIEAMARMELQGLAQRRVTNLSGGEQARVLIARAMAQDTPLLMADEPIAGLDPAHQIATMQVFGHLAQEGRAVVASLHDLGLAVRHCTRLIVLGENRVMADGAPRDVLTGDILRQVFGVSAFFQDTDQGPVFQPLEVIR